MILVTRSMVSLTAMVTRSMVSLTAMVTRSMVSLTAMVTRSMVGLIAINTVAILNTIDTIIPILAYNAPSCHDNNWLESDMMLNYKKYFLKLYLSFLISNLSSNCVINVFAV